MTYLVLKYCHVLGATVLLGTGTGIAFFNAASLQKIERLRHMPARRPDVFLLNVADGAGR